MPTLEERRKIKNEKYRKILDVLKDGRYTSVEIAKKVGMTRDYVYGALLSLTNENKVKSVRGVYPKLYWELVE